MFAHIIGNTKEVIIKTKETKGITGYKLLLNIYITLKKVDANL